MESLCTVEQYVARYGSVPDEAVLAEALLDSSAAVIAEVEADRKSTRLNSSHIATSRMPSSA